MPRCDIVIDGMFGDGGKGAAVDYLVAKHQHDWGVRWHGGANASHNVVDPDLGHHDFKMWSAGVLANRHLTTYLGKDVRVDPYVIQEEGQALADMFGGFTPYMVVHPDAVIVTAYHQIASQKKAKQHMLGSTGMGQGMAAQFAEVYPRQALYAKDLRDKAVVVDKLWRIRTILQKNGLVEKNRPMGEVDQIARMLLDGYSWFALDTEDVIGKHESVIFEGAQGLGLDKNHGTKPNVTNSDCTPYAIAEQFPHQWGLATFHLVSRTYSHRHGAGEFPTEDESLVLPEPHNADDVPHFQGKFRRGDLDLFSLKHNLQFAPQINALHLSHFDLWTQRPFWNLRITKHITARFNNPLEFIKRIEKTLNIPVAVVAKGQTRKDRRERYRI